MKTFYFQILLLCFLPFFALGQSIEDVREIQVFNFNNEESLSTYKEMNLDNDYMNLLDPRNIMEEEQKEVFESWSSFH